MNEALTDFRAVIRLWPSRGALARDLDLPKITVDAWHRSNSVPPRWYEPLTKAAIKRDIDGVDSAMLLRLHEKRVEAGPPAPRSKKNELQAAEA